MGRKYGAELRNQRRLRGDKQWPRKARGRAGVRPDAWCEGGGWPGRAAEKSHTSAPRHLAVEKNERQSRQKQQGAPPEVGAAAACEFFTGNRPNVLPRVLIILAFPAVVEILELPVVIFKRLLGMVPQEKPGGSIGPRVQGMREEERVSRQPPVVVADKSDGQRQHNGQWRKNSDDARARRCGRFCLSCEPPEEPASDGDTEDQTLIGPGVRQDGDPQAEQ